MLNRSQIYTMIAIRNRPGSVFNPKGREYRLPIDVIQKIEKSGLVDAMNYVKQPYTFSVPTPSNKDPHHMAKIRVDYAFIAKSFVKYLQAAKIFKNSDTKTASDHYPFFIELK